MKRQWTELLPLRICDIWKVIYLHQVVSVCCAPVWLFCCHFSQERLQDPASEEFTLGRVMSTSIWLCVCLRPSAVQEEMAGPFPRVSHPSFACGKSTSKQFLLLSIKTYTQQQFQQMYWFSMLLLLLMFVLLSKSSKISLEFHTVFKHSDPLVSIFLPVFVSSSLPLYILFVSFLPSFLHLFPQNSVSFCQNNNNKLSDAARWHAHTPEGTESHSSTQTDNPLQSQPSPVWNCAHLHQSDPLKLMQEKAERWKEMRIVHIEVQR